MLRDPEVPAGRLRKQGAARCPAADAGKRLLRAEGALHALTCGQPEDQPCGPRAPRRRGHLQELVRKQAARLHEPLLLLIVVVLTTCGPLGHIDPSSLLRCSLGGRDAARRAGGGLRSRLQAGTARLLGLLVRQERGRKLLVLLPTELRGLADDPRLCIASVLLKGLQRSDKAIDDRLPARALRAREHLHGVHGQGQNHGQRWQAFRRQLLQVRPTKGAAAAAPEDGVLAKQDGHLL
mmetsp:Transcript_56774/g.166152  ORF Transcript_56774/g.166152 Transcript_56774/m.166152 type:complete len:237 (+) Transcript_56774:450-1160(+)